MTIFCECCACTFQYHHVNNVIFVWCHSMYSRFKIWTEGWRSQWKYIIHNKGDMNNQQNKFDVIKAWRHKCFERMHKSVWNHPTLYHIVCMNHMNQRINQSEVQQNILWFLNGYTKNIFIGRCFHCQLNILCNLIFRPDLLGNQDMTSDEFFKQVHVWYIIIRKRIDKKRKFQFEILSYIVPSKVSG